MGGIYYSSIIMRDVSFLQSIAGRLEKDTSATLLCAAEIEFYLVLQEAQHEAVLLSAIYQACSVVPLMVGEIEKERGNGQYEIQLSPVADPVILADAIVAIKEIITTTAKAYYAEALFSSKPYADEPGSSIHIHINLVDTEGVNLFQKEGEEESLILLHAIGGICTTLRETMPICAPTEASYARFVPNNNSPTTISWGGNNRTVALRIPSGLPCNRRIEHRVAGAESDPYLLIAAILVGVYHGVTQKIIPPAKIYGDASHAQYALPPLPKTLEEAMTAYKKGDVIRKFITLK